MDLPLELRHNIYCYSLRLAEKLDLSDFRSFIDGSNNTKLPPLAHCSRALRMEMLPALIQANIWNFESFGEVTFLLLSIELVERNIATDFFQNVRSVSFNIDCPIDGEDWMFIQGKPLLKKLEQLQNCPKLQYVFFDWRIRHPYNTYKDDRHVWLGEFPEDLLATMVGRVFVGKLKHNKALRSISMIIHADENVIWDKHIDQLEWRTTLMDEMKSMFKTALEVEAKKEMPWMSDVSVCTVYDLEKGYQYDL